MTMPDRLFQIIEQQTGLTREQITSEGRDEELVFARRIVCYFLNEDKMAQRVIAQILNRDRTTIRGMIREHESQYKYNAKFRSLFDTITEKLKDRDLVIRFRADEVYSPFK